MKATHVIFGGPGKVHLRDIDVADPKPHEIQVKCLANGICMYEVSIFRGTEATPVWPAGHEGIGVVTKVGSEVTGIAEGDCVTTVQWATLQNQPASTTARFQRIPADPALFFVEPCSCVVTAWNSYDLAAGDRVLILGVGYMGLLNVQALAGCPLAELVVADVKPDNLALATSFGATEAVNVATPEGKARLEALKARPLDLVIEAAGTTQTIQMAGPLTRVGGRLSVFAWHHGLESVDMTVWHLRGLRVLNSAPPIGTDHAVNSMQRAVWLLERGVFDQGRLVTHRHPFSDVQEALELAAARPQGYRKGVLVFP